MKNIYPYANYVKAPKLVKESENLRANDFLIKLQISLEFANIRQIWHFDAYYLYLDVVVHG